MSCGNRARPLSFRPRERGQVVDCLRGAVSRSRCTAFPVKPVPHEIARLCPPWRLLRADASHRMCKPFVGELPFEKPVCYKRVRHWGVAARTRGGVRVNTLGFGHGAGDPKDLARPLASVPCTRVGRRGTVPKRISRPTPMVPLWKRSSSRPRWSVSPRSATKRKFCP
jgi:hypothetical protein